MAYTVQTVDGQGFSGLITGESAVSLTAKRAGGLSEIVLLETDRGGCLDRRQPER